MQILRAVVHKVIKEQHQSEAEIQFKNGLFTIDPKLNDFVINFEKVYQKHRGKVYGIFENEETPHSFQKHMDKYLKQQDDNPFYQFSIDATNLFKQRLTEAQASTGGYLFFIHYKNDLAKEYLVIAVLNDKLGYAIQQDTLELLGVINLNMDHLSMAARIDMQEYTGKTDESYLSFIRGEKKIRNYFISFIGCKDYQSSKTSTERTIKVLYDYCKNKKLNTEAKRRLESNLYSFLKENQEIDLYVLSQKLLGEQAEEFYSLLQQAEISDKYEPAHDIAKRLVRFNYERNGVKIEFTKDKLDSQEILYDDKKKELIIRDCDGELGKRIKDEFEYGS